MTTPNDTPRPDHDDPQLTAYALGELEGDAFAQERAAVEARLAQDPALREQAAAIAQLARQLESGYERSAQTGLPDAALRAPCPSRRAPRLGARLRLRMRTPMQHRPSRPTRPKSKRRNPRARSPGCSLTPPSPPARPGPPRSVSSRCRGQAATHRSPHLRPKSSSPARRRRNRAR
ncbi:hypothetical protein OT109_13515 [Phycisphaeraceae bacterium D3-23]